MYYALDDDRLPYLIEYGAKRFFAHLQLYLELVCEKWNGLSPEELQKDPLVIQVLSDQYDDDGHYFKQEEVLYINSTSPF